MIEKSCHHPPKHISHPTNWATNFSGSCGKSNSALTLCLKRKENEGPGEQGTAERQKAKEVREYMHRQVFERQKREQQMRRKAEFEKERKKRGLLDIVKKQKEALRRTRKQQTQMSEVCFWQVFQSGSTFKSAP